MFAVLLVAEALDQYVNVCVLPGAGQAVLVVVPDHLFRSDTRDGDGVDCGDSQNEGSEDG